MLPALPRLAILLLLAVTALAQPSHIGDAFPLTDTRYGTSRGHDPLLLSNGRDPVVFWSDDRDARTFHIALDPASRYAFRIRAWNESGAARIQASPRQARRSVAPCDNPVPSPRRVGRGLG